jgi:hypothetical protein
VLAECKDRLLLEELRNHELSSPNLKSNQQKEAVGRYVGDKVDLRYS